MILITKDKLFLLREIVERNFSSKYKDSVLGIIWAILNPLLVMALFTILFSTIFGRNIENYSVYFLCGWCIFSSFSKSISSSMSALKGNKSILKRTTAPKYIFVLGSILSELLNLLIVLMLLVAVMIITHAPFHLPAILFSFIPIASLLIMVTGLGLMLAVVCVYYSDVKHLWGVVSLMLMYASAIFYPMEIVPEQYRQYLLLNPIYWIIDHFRTFVYMGEFPKFVSLANSFLLSLIILVFGIIIFKKYEKGVTMKF